MEIVKELVYPPIPIRDYDWQAWVDGEEEVSVWGRTEEAAVADLKEQLDQPR